LFVKAFGVFRRAVSSGVGLEVVLALRRVEFLHRHNFTVIEEEKFEENYSN